MVLASQVPQGNVHDAHAHSHLLTHGLFEVVVDVLTLQRIAPEQACGEAGDGGVVHWRAAGVCARQANIAVDANSAVAPLHGTAGLVHRNANGGKS